MQEKELVVKAPQEIRVVGEGGDYPLCSRRCQWFAIGHCALFDCDLHRDAEGQWPRCRACMRAPVDANASDPEQGGDVDLREKYPAFDSPTKAFHGSRYVPVRVAADAADCIRDKYLKGKGVHFWIYVLCTAPLPDGEKQPTSLPAKATRVKKNVPKEIAKDMNAEDKAAFSKAMEGDAPVWFIKLEDVGWDWADKNGAKQVQQVQDALEWINKFRAQKTVNGAKLLYCDVSNENV